MITLAVHKLFVKYNTVQYITIQGNIIQILVMIRLQNDNISCSQTVHEQILYWTEIEYVHHQ